VTPVSTAGDRMPDSVGRCAALTAVAQLDRPITLTLSTPSERASRPVIGWRDFVGRVPVASMAGAPESPCGSSTESSTTSRELLTATVTGGRRTAGRGRSAPSGGRSWTARVVLLARRSQVRVLPGAQDKEPGHEPFPGVRNPPEPARPQQSPHPIVEDAVDELARFSRIPATSRRWWPLQVAGGRRDPDTGSCGPWLFGRRRRVSLPLRAVVGSSCGERSSVILGRVVREEPRSGGARCRLIRATRRARQRPRGRCRPWLPDEVPSAVLARPDRHFGVGHFAAPGWWPFVAASRWFTVRGRPGIVPGRIGGGRLLR
jgi:hypothetical protein